MAFMGAGIEQDHLETKNQHGLKFEMIHTWYAYLTIPLFFSFLSLVSNF
jgi:hypothetical protein